MQKPAGQQPRKSNRMRWIIGAIIALFVCGGIASVASPPSSSKTPKQEAASQAALQAATIAVEATSAPVDKPTQLPPTEIVQPPAATPTAAAVDPPATDTPAPPEATAAPATAAPAQSSSYAATASIDNASPPQNGSVRVTGKLTKEGKPVQGAIMNASFEYSGGPSTEEGAKTKADGTAGYTRKIGRAKSGFEVEVVLTFTVDGAQVATAKTSFTPK